VLEVDRGLGLEDVEVRPEADARAGLLRRDALDLAQLVARLELALVVEVTCDAVLERELVRGAVAVDLGDELRRQRVHDRGTHAVQAARRAVGAAAELAAGVQFGEHDLERGHLSFGVLVDGDAAPVVEDLDGTVAVERDLDAVRVARSGFVDGVVDELPHQVQQSGAAGAADVHARPLAHGVEPFEGLDGVGVVAGLRCLGGAGGFGGTGGHGSSRHQRAEPMASTRRPWSA
jgi:hypothetical protein